jgi:ketosteroid isomerase-like protein
MRDVVQAVADAINARDVAALGECFAADYPSEQPAHPSRSFIGREQMVKNWSAILAGVPDITATIVRTTTAGSTAWAEWDWRGTKADGSPFAMRGVTIGGVDGDEFSWVRFYMEPVDADAIDVETAVNQVVQGTRA